MNTKQIKEVKQKLRKQGKLEFDDLTDDENSS